MDTLCDKHLECLKNKQSKSLIRFLIENPLDDQIGIDFMRKNKSLSSLNFKQVRCLIQSLSKFDIVNLRTNFTTIISTRYLTYVYLSNNPEIFTYLDNTYVCYKNARYDVNILDNILNNIEKYYYSTNFIDICEKYLQYEGHNEDIYRCMTKYMIDAFYSSLSIVVYNIAYTEVNDKVIITVLIKDNNEPAINRLNYHQRIRIHKEINKY